MTIFTPEDVAPDARRPGLNGHEEAWLERRRREAEERAAQESGRRLVGPGRKVNRAADGYAVATSRTAAAILNATATAPPQPPPRLARPASSTSDPSTSDPTVAPITSTESAVERACERLGHLLGRCAAPECVCQERDTLATLLDELGAPLDSGHVSTVVDGLVGTPPSSRRALHELLVGSTHPADGHPGAIALHTSGAATLAEAWHAARRDGAETDFLVAMADRIDEHADRARRLLGTVAQWHPGPMVRRCEGGCGGAAPPVGEGATCNRCRTRASRCDTPRCQQTATTSGRCPQCADYIRRHGDEPPPDTVTAWRSARRAATEQERAG